MADLPVAQVVTPEEVYRAVPPVTWLLPHPVPGSRSSSLHRHAPHEEPSVREQLNPSEDYGIHEGARARVSIMGSNRPGSRRRGTRGKGRRCRHARHPGREGMDVTPERQVLSTWARVQVITPHVVPPWPPRTTTSRRHTVASRSTATQHQAATAPSEHLEMMQLHNRIESCSVMDPTRSPLAPFRPRRSPPPQPDPRYLPRPDPARRLMLQGRIYEREWLEDSPDLELRFRCIGFAASERAF